MGNGSKKSMCAPDTTHIEDGPNDAHDTIVDRHIDHGPNHNTPTQCVAYADTLPQQLAAQAQQRHLQARARPSRPTRGTKAPAWTHTHTASPTQQCGMQAETQVCQYLQTHGVRVLERNLQTKHGEIDIACLDDGVLAFVEVRQRRSIRYGGAAASVGRNKQARLIRTAHVWLPRLTANYFGSNTPQCRFDVVVVQCGRIDWFKHAFQIY